jgi:cyanobactin maturation PatA/PatG family protease
MLSPSTSRQEWMHRLPGLDQLWGITSGSPEVRVAVLDGPIEGLSEAETEPSHALGHGTLVASIATKSLDGAVLGLAPGCSIISIPIFRDDTTPDEPPACSQETLAQAIISATSFGAHVINISAAQLSDPLSLKACLARAIENALLQDVLIVAAVGNHGCACDTIPASIGGVLAVGAHDEAGLPLGISNWGLAQRGQGLLAPGVALPGVCVGGGICRATGTSFAAAVVTGVAGLLMSAALSRGEKIGGARVKHILLRSADPCHPEAHELCSSHLAGRLNVRRAMRVFLGVTPAFSKGGITTMSDDVFVAAGDPTAEAARASGANESGLGSSGPASYIRDSAEVVQREAIRLAGCGCGGACTGECECGGHAKPQATTRPQYVYAIGRLGISFISPARRDSIWRVVNGTRDGDLKPISDEALRQLFEKQPYQAQSVVWTLSRTEVPMYAIVPSGPFGAEVYRWMVEEWADHDVEFISVPGVSAGEITLYDGNQVEVLVPDLRGMHSWERARYRDALFSARKETPGESEERVKLEIERFLGKVMYRIRNRGRTPEERALNSAITNAFNFSDVIAQAVSEQLVLRDVTVERSPLNRPGSDYFDVLVTFFNPRDRQGTANLSARFTVDVSDTVPVIVGEPVTWFEY